MLTAAITGAVAGAAAALAVVAGSIGLRLPPPEWRASCTLAWCTALSRPDPGPQTPGTPESVSLLSPPSLLVQHPGGTTTQQPSSPREASLPPFSSPFSSFASLFEVYASSDVEYCYDPSMTKNDGYEGTSSNVSFYYGDAPVPVDHSYKENVLDRMDLWMYLSKARTNTSLMYVPGRTIVFDDFHHALR